MRCKSKKNTFQYVCKAKILKNHYAKKGSVWYFSGYMRSEYKSNRNTLMKTEKELYTAPALRLLPLQLETGLCASGDWGTGDLPGFEFEDGDD